MALILIGFLSLRNLDQMERESAMVVHTEQVMGALRTLTAAIASVESAGRGYVISGEAQIKYALEGQRQTALEAVRNLRESTKDNPAQQQRIAALTELVAQRAEMSRELIELKDEGQLDSATAAELVKRGQAVSDQIWTLQREVYLEESALLTERRHDAVEAAAFTRSVIIYGSIAAVLVVAISGIFASRSITAPLDQLRISASRIGEGDYAHRAPVLRDDEVGQLAAVFNKMAAQVQQRQTALENQDWLKSGLARFDALYQRQRDPVVLCNQVLAELASLVGAQALVIYRVKEENGWRGVALCAVHAAANPPERFAIGEGLPGQCYADKRRLHLRGTPPDYLRITSALGSAQPAEVLVEPVLFEGQPKAVLEIASLRTFTPLQLELIAQLAAGLGITLHTIEGALRTEELLRQSQALAAQLEQQSATLAAKNTELEEQADRLRKSEQLLQEQQVELTQTNEELEQTNEELQQSNEEMEEKSNLLAEQKRELERSNRAIEQARAELQEQARQLAITSKYKSDFLATMSHELRTPLNSLLILARLLGENSDGNLTAKQVQFAQTIESSGADLLEMINQILDLAKIESGKVELQIDDVSVQELQRSLEQQFRHMADAKKLAFKVSFDPAMPPAVRTDIRRLQQILKNLLSNAFKFTERGSVDVSIRPVSDGWSPHPSLDKAAKVIAFSVSDTGIGIPKEKQQLVFESFQQADAGTSRRYGGTGLGLSISREIAQLLGGVLRLSSEPGKGSTFTLYIPAEIEAPAPTSLPTSEKPAAPAVVAEIPEELPVEEEELGIKDDRDSIEPDDRVFLVIEDDPRFASILLDFVREKNFKALVAGSARTGLALAQRFRPAAITLDLRLADEDGWLVLDRLKHDERTRHIPVHVISVEPARSRGLRLGAVSYLQKPVTKEAIADILQQTVDFIERPVKRLLVVEDDPVQRETIRELIGNGDVKTITAGNAAEALAALAKDRYDCVVMDLMLPDKTGVELIREINAIHGLHAPPVIVYTGKELTPAEETELRSLSESIIVKDVRSPERLLDETALFLHRVQSKLPEAKRRMLEQVRKQDSVLNGRRVLVVDDDVRNIFALTARLEAYGMIVRFAESGQAALTALEEDPACDVVLMDVMMPEMDGYEAIRRLRKNPRFARLPIISVTAKAMKGDRDRCIEAGASDYITKPVDTEKLISLLRVWLYR
jgi:Signal transduction histidine kinase